MQSLRYSIAENRATYKRNQKNSEDVSKQIKTERKWVSVIEFGCEVVLTSDALRVCKIRKCQVLISLFAGRNPRARLAMNMPYYCDTTGRSPLPGASIFHTDPLSSPCPASFYF